MTNPLTEQELQAAQKAWRKVRPPDGAILTPSAAHMFSAGIAHLRAELAKAEPVANGLMLDDHSFYDIHPNKYCEERLGLRSVNLYLRPTEPSKCPWIETSKGGTSYCRLAAGQSKEEPVAWFNPGTNELILDEGDEGFAGFEPLYRRTSKEKDHG